MESQASVSPIVLIDRLWLTPRGWDHPELKGGPQFTADAPGWEDVADCALEWATGHAGAPAEPKPAAL